MNLENIGKYNLSIEQLTEILQVSKEELKAFEMRYKKESINLPDDNQFRQNAKKAVSELKQNAINNNGELANKISEELLSNYTMYEQVGNHYSWYNYERQIDNYVSLEQITNEPVNNRPQLSGKFMNIDYIASSSSYLLSLYKMHLEEKNIVKKNLYYDTFRQGLDILDLDPLIYEMLGENKNSMGYWFPKLQEASFNKNKLILPQTQILKVPMQVLQLTRNDFQNITPISKEIVNKFCYNAFHLEEQKKYFIKTGTYSSKFDFRNALIDDANELREIGECFLFLQNNASQKASPLNNPSIYGISTTNEWVVREFIEDVENNPTIYKGLPLRTEFRFFVDFDRKKILGVTPYWEEKTMIKRFSNCSNIHDNHDFITFLANSPKLKKDYKEFLKQVTKGVEELVSTTNLSGQWSIDIMKNGNNFYVIDMAIAENSAFYDCVPKKQRVRSSENWLPRI